MKYMVLTIKKVIQLEFIIPFLAFFIPFLVSGPQLLTGTIVNAFLLIYASKSFQKNLWLICAIPSLGALSHNMLFAKFTPFLIYFLPIIWIGNFIYIKTYLKLKNSSFVIKIFISSLLKSFWLFLFAQIFFSIHLVPKLFLTSMGIIQFTTAFIGGLIAIILIKNYDRI